MLGNVLLGSLGLILLLECSIIIYGVINTKKPIAAMTYDIVKIDTAMQKKIIPIQPKTDKLNRDELSKKINEKHGPKCQ